MWRLYQKVFTLLDSCMSSLRRGHANLLCIVPSLTDDPRRESTREMWRLYRQTEKGGWKRGVGLILVKMKITAC